MDKIPPRHLDWLFSHVGDSPPGDLKFARSIMADLVQNLGDTNESGANNPVFAPRSSHVLVRCAITIPNIIDRTRTTYQKYTGLGLGLVLSDFSSQLSAGFFI